MRLIVPALAVLMAAGAFAGERHKIDIDPESQDGILLQRIRQEPQIPRRLALLEKYVVQYPKASSIPWVYDQLLTIYLDTKDLDKALRMAETVLALDPADLDAAHVALQIAEQKKDPELVRQYALICWDLASKVTESKRPADPEEASDWAKQLEFSKQVMSYSEYLLSSQAIQEEDADRKAGLIAELEKRNPQSKFLASTRKGAFHTYALAVNSERALAESEQSLITDPNNEDLLMAVAEYLMGQERDLPRVLSYSLRVLEQLQKKSKPDEISEDAWTKKRARYSGAANWLIGVIYGKQARYGVSERYLRASLPNIGDNPQLLAAAYFYLGYDNYGMAGEMHDRGRAVEAVRYSAMCAAINGPFQSLAEKNLDLIKKEYNLR